LTRKKTEMMTAHSMGQATPLEAHRQILSELWKKLNDWCAKAADLRAGGQEADSLEQSPPFGLSPGSWDIASRLWLWSSIEPVSLEWVKVVGKTPRICRAACSYET